MLENPTYRQHVEAELADIYPEHIDKILFMDGFDIALIGHVVIDGRPVMAYSYTLILESLVIDQEMTCEDALDHFGYNIQGAYVGEYTPVIVYDGTF
jgi:hypothetical protein